MEEDKMFIRVNLSLLLTAQEVKAKTGGIDGLQLHDIHYIHSTPRNIEFSLSLVNGAACFRVDGKINRATAKFSKIVVDEV